MAVITERRLRPDRVAKDRFPGAEALKEPHVAIKMSSYPDPNQPPGANEHIPLTSPASGENFAVPQVGHDRDALRRRKASKAKPLQELRRSASTPHLSKMSHGDSGILSPTDKKRNKLGYHRTSIACSHCRRRKIRCQLPIQEDPQGRCTNCIRLKKECNFYPVDQATTLDGRPAPPPPKKDLGIPGAPSTSSQSSPHISGASSIPEDPHGHLHSPKSIVDIRQQQEIGEFGMTPVTGASVQSAPFNFASPIGATWPGQSTPTDRYAQQQRPSMSESPYWSVNTPTTAQYTHEPVMSFNASTPTSFANPSFPYSESGHPGAPGRSMSYGHIEGMSQQYGYQNVHYSHQEAQAGYPMPPQSPYGTPLMNQGHGGMVQTPDSTPRAWSNAPPAHVPASAGAQHTPVLPSSYYPSPQSYNAFDSRNPSSYAGQQQFYPPGSHPG